MKLLPSHLKLALWKPRHPSEDAAVGAVLEAFSSFQLKIDLDINHKLK